MSKQVLDPKDKAGFMNLSSDGKHTQIVEAYAKSGKELEQYLEQSGAELKKKDIIFIKMQMEILKKSLRKKEKHIKQNKKDKEQLEK